MRYTVLVLALALLAGCGGDSEPEAQGCDVMITDESRAKDIEPLSPGDYSIEFQTSHGNFTVDVDETLSPCNGDSMLQLAKDGFFDGIVFHRIVPDFVIQAGQSGKTPDGGPGYTTVDTPAADTTYPNGLVAMAKTETDPPGTGGSQFFVVTGPDVMLPPDYAPIGKVVKGMAVVDKIGKLGDPSTQAPTSRIVIKKAVASGI
jgi:cyclophilin family peptidyl-prolyl cis-trans isomerase